MCREQKFNFKVSWSVQREGEFSYLHEKTNNGTVIYGPMPRDAVGPLIDERREFFEEMMKSLTPKPTDTAEKEVGDDEA